MAGLLMLIYLLAVITVTLFMADAGFSMAWASLIRKLTLARRFRLQPTLRELYCLGPGRLVFAIFALVFLLALTAMMSLYLQMQGWPLLWIIAPIAASFLVIYATYAFSEQIEFAVLKLQVRYCLRSMSDQISAAWHEWPQTEKMNASIGSVVLMGESKSFCCIEKPKAHWFSVRFGPVIRKTTNGFEFQLFDFPSQTIAFDVHSGSFFLRDQEILVDDLI